MVFNESFTVLYVLIVSVPYEKVGVKTNHSTMAMEKAMAITRFVFVGTYCDTSPIQYNAMDI